jgi:hypothetical protein
MIKLIDILNEIESNKILVPRRPEGRKEKQMDIINKIIQQYIKDGSKGNLNLDNTPLSSLPDNLVKVGGYLNLSSTKITSLPDNLQIGGSFLLFNTKITSLPDNLKVVGKLDLSNSKINSIPNNLQVDGTLSLYDTPLAKKYNSIEIKQMIEDKGGYVKGVILGGKAIE